VQCFDPIKSHSQRRIQEMHFVFWWLAFVGLPVARGIKAIAVPLSGRVPQN
jgi:hypothetical protein